MSTNHKRTAPRAAATIIAILCLLLAACGSSRPSVNSILTTAGVGTPAACPTSHVNVTTGSIPSFSSNTNYCFAAGTYSNFAQTIQPGDGWYGGGGAILDGGNGRAVAINGNAGASNITIDGFTIQHYAFNCSGPTFECQVPPSGYSVDIFSGTNIMVSNNIFQNDAPGNWQGDGGVSLGGSANPGQYDTCGCYTVVTNSSIVHNLFSNLMWSGPTVGNCTGCSISFNEVTKTDAGAFFGQGMDTENFMSAIGKFDVDASTTVNGNYLHDNGAGGIWFDSYNPNSIITNNVFGADSSGQQSAKFGAYLEISCNSVISNNTFADIGYNGAGGGGGNIPGAAVRISSSGASTFGGCGGESNNDPNNDMPGPRSITISNNTMTDDVVGVALYKGHSGVTNNINVTGNTMTATTRAAYNQSGTAYQGPTDPSNQLEEISGTGGPISYSNNTYTVNPSKTAMFQGGSFSSWKSGFGFDTAGTTCAIVGAGAC